MLSRLIAQQPKSAMDRRIRGIIAATFIAQGLAVGATIGAFSLFLGPLRTASKLPGSELRVRHDCVRRAQIHEHLQITGLIIPTLRRQIPSPLRALQIYAYAAKCFYQLSTLKGFAKDFVASCRVAVFLVF
jgi:hypothetical protein